MTDKVQASEVEEPLLSNMSYPKSSSNSHLKYPRQAPLVKPQYPTQQQQSYPTMASYPTNISAPELPEKPPAYQSFPTQPYPTQPYTQVSIPMLNGMPSQPPLPSNVAVVIPDCYHQSARFDGIAQRRVPPPPPGVAPNLAQQALYYGQGNQLILGQKKQSFL